MKTRFYIITILFLNFYTLVFTTESAARNFSNSADSVPALFRTLCEIDYYYDSLVKLKVEDILSYKEINTPTGNKSLLIWKIGEKAYCLKFKVDNEGLCKIEQISMENNKLVLLAKTFFNSEQRNYSVSKSKIEDTHSFWVNIRALIGGKEILAEFLDTSIWNQSEFLPEISRLCVDIIYNL